MIASIHTSVDYSHRFNRPALATNQAREDKNKGISVNNEDVQENQTRVNGTRKTEGVENENTKTTVTKVEAELSEQELKQLRELKNRDREVHAHEQAHAAVAGSLAKGGPSYQYQRGPDGRLYAVGGEVQIDTSAVAGDPQATAEKARQIRRAALAPAQPSQQDRSVAAAAVAMEAQARVEIARQEKENGVEGLNQRFSTEETGRDESVINNNDNNSQDVNSKCAQCGGQHSAESHSVAVTLGEVFMPVSENEEQAGVLNISV